MTDQVCTQIGLTTDEALKQLLIILRAEIASEKLRLEPNSKSKISRFLHEILSALHHNPSNCPWTFCGIYSLLCFCVTIFLFIGSFASERVDSGQLICALISLLLVILNIFLTVRLRYCRSHEHLRKAECLLRKLTSQKKRMIRKGLILECTDLFSPVSECINLQWTYRDGKLVNLSWILLVEGDVIQVRPGRQVPCRCRKYSSQVNDLHPHEMAPGDTFCRRERKDPTTGAVIPFEPILCEVIETPLATHIRSIFRGGCRPATFLENELSQVLHHVLERIIIPILLLSAFVLGIVRCFYWSETSGTNMELIVTLPAMILLPIMGITFPLLLFVINCLNMVAVIRELDNGKDLTMTNSSLDSLYSTQLFTQTTRLDKNGKRHSLFSAFQRAISCDPKHLPVTANLVQTLGNVTVVSVVDKKGILSFPNPTPEKIFFLRETSNVTRESSFRKVPSAGTLHSNIHQEVLDLTHEPDQAFTVNFDDPMWTRYLNNLKPLGLNIQLNCCDLNREYVKFLDHVTVISKSVPRTIAVVNRRCCCQLASVFGFSPLSTQQFKHDGSTHSRVLASYKKEPGDPPLPGLTKHRTPLSHLFATVSGDSRSIHSHVMTQGTADLVLEASAHYWNGSSVQELSRTLRRRIADSYNRHSMTSYCVGFSYKSIRNTITDSLGEQYIDWPENKHNKSPLGLKMKSVSLESLVSDDFASQDCAQTADDVIESAFSDQIFLALMTLQYQAKQDVVKVVEQLDKACIRFVHFSKENELRSRIFAEKLGLEAGWNCHISLTSEGSVDSHNRKSMSSPRTSVLTSEVDSQTPNSKCALRRSNSFPKDLKISFPHVQFRATTEEQSEVSPFSQHSDNMLSARAPIAMSDDAISVGSSIGSMADDEQISIKVPHRRHYDYEQRTPLLSQASSRTSISSGVGSANPGIFPNIARLPVGVEQVVPHLEQVDNVPLLVSLFTDCNHASTREMIRIMQQYGEVVLVVGSSLNVYNCDIFCQANASVAVEPLHPAPCCRQPVSPAPSDRSGAKMAASLIALPCSLMLSAGQQLNLMPLIGLCRHKLTVTRTALIFFLNCCLFLSVIQFAPILIFLPPIITAPQLMIWICLTLPIFSLSFCQSPLDSYVSLRMTTPKNKNWVAKKVTRLFVQAFLIKFLPTLLFTVILYGAVLRELCASIENSDCFFHIDQNRTGILIGNWAHWSGQYNFGWTLARQISAFFLTVYLCVISSGFVQYREQMWRSCPVRNIYWVFGSIFAILLQIAFYFLEMTTSSMFVSFSISDVSWYVYVAGFIWIVPLLTVNELYKRREITMYTRDQRRRRLSFGTKLGMNSPY